MCECGKLEITPEGETRTLVFGGSATCGKAFNGLSFNIKGEAGGVLTNVDARKLMEHIRVHLSQHVN